MSLLVSPLKLRELGVSYKLPENMLSRMSIQSARIGVVVRNLAVWTEVPNVDAETFSNSDQAGNVPGYDQGAIPSPRTIALNLNLKF